MCVLTSQGYKHQKAYIIAEGPRASTVRNMWKLVYDRKCGTLVMLTELVENGMVCLSYFVNNLYTRPKTVLTGMLFPVLASYHRRVGAVWGVHSRTEK